MTRHEIRHDLVHRYRGAEPVHECETGRVGYRSPQHARLANERQTKRVRVYRCEVCHLYHVTASSLISRPDRFAQAPNRNPYRREKGSTE